MPWGPHGTTCTDTHAHTSSKMGLGVIYRFGRIFMIIWAILLSLYQLYCKGYLRHILLIHINPSDMHRNKFVSDRYGAAENDNN